MNKKLIVGSALAILFVVVIGVAVFLYLKSKQDLPSNPDSTSQLEPSTTPTPEIEFTADSTNKGKNILENPGLEKCNAENWDRIITSTRTTNLSVINNSAAAASGNCYLATNSGSNTDAGTGLAIYQDVYIGDRKITRLKYGAKIGMDNKDSGKAGFVLFEFNDAKEKIIRTNTYPITVTKNYQEFSKEVIVSADTKYLRIQLYINSVGTYKLDDAYINVLAENNPTDYAYGNLINNFGFNNCHANGWNKISPSGSATNLSIINDKANAYSGSCYMAANCGANKCAAGQSVYYDITLPAGVKSIDYGAYVGSTGFTGRANLAIHQFDSKGKRIAGKDYPLLAIGPAYKFYKTNTNINSATKKIRIEFYMATPGTFKLDDIFVLPNK